jgi:hypothetical protein
MKNYGENFQKQFAFVSENFIKICQEMTFVYIYCGFIWNIQGKWKVPLTVSKKYIVHWEK